MVLAWMFFAPVGIFTAKFFRTNKAICGQKLWFQVSSNHIILFKEELVLGLGLGLGGECKIDKNKWTKTLFSGKK